MLLLLGYEGNPGLSSAFIGMGTNPNSLLPLLQKGEE
jgi:hypothetical protein